MSKIHVLLRHNVNSINRKQNVRPEWFSYQSCFDSLLLTHSKDVTFDILLDGGNVNSHHVNFRNINNVYEVQCGTDASSFLELLYFVKKNYLDGKWGLNDVVYFVEDDYLHLNKWDVILSEGIQLNKNGYVSLYDHPDKYFLPMYSELKSKLYIGNYSHWRETPSCCNTYACRIETLIRDFDIHEHYSLPEHTFDGYDHHKFLSLNKKGSFLISPIRAFSTHCENNFLSPFVNWERHAKN